MFPLLPSTDHKPWHNFFTWLIFSSHHTESSKIWMPSFLQACAGIIVCLFMGVVGFLFAWFFFCQKYHFALILNNFLIQISSLHYSPWTLWPIRSWARVENTATTRHKYKGQDTSANIFEAKLHAAALPNF